MWLHPADFLKLGYRRPFVDRSGGTDSPECPGEFRRADAAAADCPQDDVVNRKRAFEIVVCAESSGVARASSNEAATTAHAAVVNTWRMNY
jgi:hypothetical protein